MFFQRPFDDVHVRRTVFREQHHLRIHNKLSASNLRLSYGTGADHEWPSAGAVGEKAVSPPYSLSASSFRPNKRRAAEATCSAVKPKFFRTSSPGADAP